MGNYTAVPRFSNYRYSASGLVRPVNTFRNQLDALAGH